MRTRLLRSETIGEKRRGGPRLVTGGSKLPHSQIRASRAFNLGEAD